MPDCAARIGAGKHGHDRGYAQFGQLIRMRGVIGRQVDREAGLDGCVPASFCASAGAASKAARHVLSPSNVSRLSRIAVTTLAMTLELTIKADMRFSFQER
jgi:hypothetical protein